MSHEPKPGYADQQQQPPPQMAPEYAAQDRSYPQAPQAAYGGQDPNAGGYGPGGYGPPPHTGTGFQQGAPPPQGGYPMQSWGPPQPQGTPIAALGGHPAPVVCPNCHHSGVTAVEYSSGGFTHGVAALTCFVTCLGCIPYFFSGLKNATHKCTKCGIPLATYHRSGHTEVHIQN